MGSIMLNIVLFFVHGFISLMLGTTVAGFIVDHLADRADENPSDTKVGIYAITFFGIVGVSIYISNLLANVLVGYYPCYYSVPFALVIIGIFYWLFPGKKEEKEEEKEVTTEEETKDNTDIQVIDVK